ncbi:nicotinate-nucleotide--dimethylbenzimidazole phosphoribosyltransferase [Streptomyces xiamenensis]|uniref:nicotinate-nucleotide--dimethylbenzimidazole phosphoribosyltransferase n=1 Tax=Streptomyces xiamenensis TaxID=408015 RepID=UPI0037D657A8
MTDTGRIPEGGEPEQGFPFPVQADDVVEGEEEDLLMPGAHVAWGDAAPTPQPITPAAPRPAQLAPLFPAPRPGGTAAAWPQPAAQVPAPGAAQASVNAAAQPSPNPRPDTPPAGAAPGGGGVATAVAPGAPTPGVAPATPAAGPVPAPGADTGGGPVAPVADPAEAGATAPAADDSGAAPGAPVPDAAPAAVPGQGAYVPGPAADATPVVGDGAVSAGPEAEAAASGGAAVPGAPQTATPADGAPGAVASPVTGSGQAPPPADAATGSALPGEAPTAPGTPEAVADAVGQEQPPAEEPAATGEPGEVVATTPETTDGTVTAPEGSPAAPSGAAAAPDGQAPVPAGAPTAPAPFPAAGSAVPSPAGAVAAAAGSPVAAGAAPGTPVPGETDAVPAPAAVPAEPVGPPADGSTPAATPVAGPATVTAAAPGAPQAPAAGAPGVPAPSVEGNAPAPAVPGTHDGPVTEGSAPEAAAPDGTEAPVPAAGPAGSDAVAEPPAAAAAPAEAVVAPEGASPAEPEAPAPGTSAEAQGTAHPVPATPADSPAEPAAAATAVTPLPATAAEAPPAAVTVPAPAPTAAEAGGAPPAPAAADPAAPGGTPAPGTDAAPAPAADAAGAPPAADAVAPEPGGPTEAGPVPPDGTPEAPVPAGPPAAPAPEAAAPAAPADGPAAPPAGAPPATPAAAPGAVSITQHVAAPSGRPATSAAPPAADPAALHRLMREPRDVRHGFLPDPIPHEVLLRVLESAHTAPTSGHAQPWDFVIIRSAETRTQVHELAVRQHEAYAKSLPKGRAKQFKELKTDAIVQTPVNIVVTADPTRGGRHTPLPHQQPQLAPYSSALAVENLWLAARAEGLGVGWVSFYDDRELVRTLELPEHLEIVAYLCIGYVDAFADETETAPTGPARQRPLSWVVHDESYGRRALPGAEPHDLLSETLEDIRPLDAQALAEAWERQKRMTKPSGALGALEVISAQLCGLSRRCPPPLPEPAAVAIFAGDHGVHAQGVTPWPQEVTGQMVANFLGGGAVCNAFAQQVGAEVCVIDVGVRGELPGQPGLMPRKVRPGTADITAGPAMSREEAQRAIEVGIETARDLVAAGNRALLTGEMGIANTTVAAALIAVFTGSEPSEVTGRGTGVDDETHARKIDVVRRALHLHQPDAADPIGVLAAVGGLEHAALTGFILGGASLRVPVILDGVSAGAAALTARAIAPEAVSVCVAGHRSAEPGHMAALTALGLRPLVDLDLRLGEGTGALLALPVVQSAARAMREVATFDAAGVSDKN